MNGTGVGGFDNAVKGSTSYDFAPKQFQTRLEIAILNELKLLNICYMFVMM